jgi:hypothetical protein
MLFWSVIFNAQLAPPLILLVIHLIGNKVIGKPVNPPVLKYLGWAFCSHGCAAVGSRTFGNSGNSPVAGSGRAGSAGTTGPMTTSNSHAPNMGGASMSSGSSGFSGSSARVVWARCIGRRTRSSGATWRLRNSHRTNATEPFQHAPTAHGPHRRGAEHDCDALRCLVRSAKRGKCQRNALPKTEGLSVYLGLSEIINAT